MSPYPAHPAAAPRPPRIGATSSLHADAALLALLVNDRSASASQCKCSNVKTPLFRHLPMGQQTFVRHNPTGQSVTL